MGFMYKYEQILFVHKADYCCPNLYFEQISAGILRNPFKTWSLGVPIVTPASTLQNSFYLPTAVE